MARAGVVTLGFVTVLLGALTANLGAASACLGFPLCNGQIVPDGNHLQYIQWTHRLLAYTLFGYSVWWAWRTRARAAWGVVALVTLQVAVAAAMVLLGLQQPLQALHVALGLLIVQVLLGAVTVKLELPPWTVILHLGTAMLLLATLIVAARGRRVASPSRAGLWVLTLGFVTVLLGALTANLGAASACLGFPLCNGQLVPDGNYLQYIQWTHRLLAYTLFGYSVWWAWRTRAPAAWGVVALVTLQVAVAAAMVLLGLPRPLQALHVAVGTGVWAGIVLATAEKAGETPGKGEGPLPPSPFPGLSPAVRT